MTGARSVGRKAFGSHKCNLRVSDEFALKQIELLVEYEAGLRGKARGQTIVDLVREEADVEGYPPELRERIAEIERAIRDEAAQRALGGDIGE